MPQKLSNSSTLSKKSQSAMHLNDDERVTNGEKVWGLPKKKKKKLAIMLENVSERKWRIIRPAKGSALERKWWGRAGTLASESLRTGTSDRFWTLRHRPLRPNHCPLRIHRHRPGQNKALRLTANGPLLEPHLEAPYSANVFKVRQKAQRTLSQPA
jgi:hypothetical protein